MTIRFGYRNLLFESGATVTAGDEAGDHVDDNLLKVDPSQFWRADDLTKSYVQIDLGATKFYDTVALLYHTATNYRSLLTDTESMDTSGQWTKTNVSVTQQPRVKAAASDATSQYSITPTGATSVQHQAIWHQQMFAYSTLTDLAATTDPKFVYAVEVRESSDTNLRFATTVEGDSSYVDFDLSSGTVNGSSAASGWTITGSVTSMGTDVDNLDWYRCEMILEPVTGWNPGAGTGDLWFYIRMLDSSFNDFFIAGTEELDIAAPRLSVAHPNINTPTMPAFEPNDSDDQGALWIVKQGTAAIASPTAANSPSPPLTVASSERMRMWRDARGWAHSWYRPWDSVVFDSSRQHLLIELHDADNPAGYVDVSNIFVGETFAPARNYVSVNVNPAAAAPVATVAPGGQKRFAPTPGPRVWDLRFSYISETDAQFGFHQMGLTLQAHNPVLVLLDRDENVYGQERALWGSIVRGVQMSSGADHYIKSAAYTGAAWSVALQIEEWLK